MKETLEQIIKTVAKKYKDVGLKFENFDYPTMFKVTAIDYFIEHIPKKEMTNKMEELYKYYKENPEIVTKLVEENPID